MTDHDALLRAVCDNPRDDLPRLVYADWLEEHGHAERAAFVRTEVAVYRLPEWDPGRVRYEAAARCTDGFGLDHWRPVFPLPVGFTWGGEPPVRRGLPWLLRVQYPSRMIVQGGEILAGLPAEEVGFHDTQPELRRLAAPWLARLTGLTVVGGNYRAGRLAELARSPAAAGLERLAVGLGTGSEAEFEGFLEAPLFARLTTLRLPNMSPWLARAFFGGVTRRPPGPRFHTLGLESAGLGDDGFALLVDSTAFPHLRRLDLGHARINADRVRRLAEAPVAAGLRVLRLTGNRLGNAGAAALAAAPHLADLLDLDLGFCQVGDDGVRAVLESPLADRLAFLDLTGSPASAGMKQELRARMGERVRL